MDEHIVLKPGSGSVQADGHLVDENLKGITFWTKKHNKYASREALDLLNLKYHLEEVDTGLEQASHSQARRKRWIKKNVYSKIPLGVRAGMYFIYRYFLLLGFLDGARGFLWHFLQGFWYRLLVDVKIMEIEDRCGNDVEEIKYVLRKEHGLAS